MPDIIVPIGPGSRYNNDELRLSLRSVEKNLDVDKVYVATTVDIPWLKNVIKVPLDDPWDNNKDKNLIYKVVKTLEMYPEIDQFYFWSDDFIVLQHIDKHINAYNDRSIDYFKVNPPVTKWQKRLATTLGILRIYGYDASVNWDSHSPLLLSSNNVVKRATMLEYDGFASNYTVCTLLAYINGFKASDGVHQDTVKVTYEKEFTGEIDTRYKYLGYNDIAFGTGLREKLFKLFPDQSKYEGIEANDENGIAVFVKNLKNTDYLNKLLSSTNFHKYIFPLDAISDDIVTKANINADIMRVYLPSICDSLRLATTMATAVAKYSIIIDGNTTYTDDYLTDALSEIGNAALYTDSSNPNKTMLLNDTVKNISTNDIDSYDEYINKVKDTIKPIIIVNN